MNIGEAAKASGLTTKTVRYYADIGLVRPLVNPENGYRNYAAREISKLVFVRKARAFDFSIDDCRELLSLWEDQSRSSADVRKIASGKLAEIKSRMVELQSIHDELEHLVGSCNGDDRPDCPIISGLAAADQTDSS